MHSNEGPGLEHFLRVFIHTHDGLPSDPKEAWHPLVTPTHLLLE